MDEIVLTEELVRRGFGYDEIVRQRKRGELRSIRRGALATAGEVLGPVDAHRELIRATVPLLRTDVAISHVSAAVLHGLPVWDSDLGTVHITRPRTGGGGKRRTLVTLHSQPLAVADLTEVDGIPVTSLARTVFDLARSYPFDRAVAAGDKALAAGMALDLLAEMIERGRRWDGIRQARRLADFIDGGSESAGESVSRVRLDQFGLPAPTLQLPVTLANGRTAYGDFAWPDLGTIGEFDGFVKYETLLRPGESPSAAVVREKRREEMLRDLGLADRPMGVGGASPLRRRTGPPVGRLRPRSRHTRLHVRTLYSRTHRL